jgi:hypothetical protein
MKISPGRFLVGVAMNGYALGRNVAFDADAFRFISACKRVQNIIVHGAFRRIVNSPHM